MPQASRAKTVAVPASFSFGMDPTRSTTASSPFSRSKSSPRHTPPPTHRERLIQSGILRSPDPRAFADREFRDTDSLGIAPTPLITANAHAARRNEGAIALQWCEFFMLASS